MPDTLFPSLSGGSPGEVEQSADITDVVLPRLTDPMAELGLVEPQRVDDQGNYPLSDSTQDVTHLSSVPDDPGYHNLDEPNSNDVAIVDPTPRSQAPRPRGLSLDEQIALLTGGHERPEQSIAERQLAQLTEALLAQGRQIEALARSRNAPSQAPSGDVDPITGQAAGAPAPTPVSARDVEDIITRAIQGYDHQVMTAQQERAQLVAAQENAFARAAGAIPGLDDPNSKVNQTFWKVWNRSPLRDRPDGPIQVALQVQGLLASEAAGRAAITQRKRQASPMSPAPTATDEVGDGRRAAYEKEYQRLQLALRNGARDKDLLFKFRKLGRALGRTRPGR